MKPKILLTGKNGQVGADLATLLPDIGELVALGRRQLDLASPAEIRRVIQQVRPQVIINAAAYTAVDQAEKEESIARAINADAPAVMAEEAKKIGAALVHYSTDYVFDGTKTSPYEEDDPTSPINIYGSTKLAGERAIQASGAPHLIFRTSWVYATRGRNFLLTILRLATEREELRVVADQIGAPTWSRKIASATAVIVARIADQSNRRGSLLECRGIYNMTAAGETCWSDFATAILVKARETPPSTAWFSAATQNRPIIAQRIVPIPSAEYLTPAPRPQYSVLSNSRLLHEFDVRLENWRDQLNEAFHSPA